jgi:hypothetical protein
MQDEAQAEIEIVLVVGARTDQVSKHEIITNLLNWECFTEHAQRVVNAWW